MKTGIKCKKTWIAAFAAAALTTGTANSTELVTNGDFSQVLVGWSVAENFSSWIPYQFPAGTISLQPQSQDLGTLISQTLDVTGIASQPVGVSIDLKADWDHSAGDGIAVYLEYIDSAGDRQRAKVLYPDNATVPSDNFGNFSTSFIFPADAVRLVSVAIDKEDDEWMSADNVSITSPTLSVDPIPHLQTISPTGIAYGSTLAISGSNFGSTPGTVFIGGTTNGVVVQSWTPGLIQVLIGDACTGGNVQVDALGPRTMEKRNLSIISPHLTLSVSPETTIATAGQQVEIAVRTAFIAGYTGTVQLAVSEAPSAAVFSPNPVTGDGGSLLKFDASGLTPGIHTYTLQGQGSDGSTNTGSFNIDIREIDTFTCSADGVTYSNQTPVELNTTLTDTLGNDVTYDLPKVVWTSGNPTVAEVYQDSSPWGFPYLLPHSSGSTYIRATLPDGSYYDFNFTVDISTLPTVVAHSFSLSTMSNDPEVTNELYFATSTPMTGRSWSVSGLTGMTSVNSYYNGDQTANTMLFTLGHDTSPGTYMFTSSGTIPGGGVSSGCLLNVVADPAYGVIKGHVAQFGGEMMHGASGTMEIYDAVTGLPAFTNQVWSYTAAYTLLSIPPGNYKLNFSSDFGLNQWYPNATNYMDAATVTVVAGSTVDQINFTLAPSSEPVPDPSVSTPPSYDAATGTFSFGVQTDNGLNYEFRKSATLEEGSWFILQTIWGDGTSVVVEDTNTTGSVGFYRVTPSN